MLNAIQDRAYEPILNSPRVLHKRHLQTDSLPEDITSEIISGLIGLYSDKTDSVVNYRLSSICKSYPKQAELWAKTSLDVKKPHIAAHIYYDLGIFSHLHRAKLQTPPAWDHFLNATCSLVLETTHTDVCWSGVSLFQYPSFWKGSQDRVEYYWHITYEQSWLGNYFDGTPRERVYVAKSLALLNYKNAAATMVDNSKLFAFMEENSQNPDNDIDFRREATEMISILEELKKFRQTRFFANLKFASGLLTGDTSRGKNKDI